VENAGKRGKDFLIANVIAAGRPSVGVRLSCLCNHQRNYLEGNPMFRTFTCLSAVLLVAGSLHGASAQSSNPAPAEAKPSRMKLTAEKLREMKAKWLANKGKLRACRKKDWPATSAGSISKTVWKRPKYLRIADSDQQRGMTAGAACPLNAYEGCVITLGIWHATN
jgi:hypothetical protein